MTPEELLEDLKAGKKGFKARKFAAGLLLAFIDFLKHLDAFDGDYESLEALLDAFPRQTTTNAGKNANTLIVAVEGGTASLRPFYNEAERIFRAEHKRFDYPSCAPHATQAWADYIGWLDALVTFTDDEADWLRQEVIAFVLDALPSQAFDPSTVLLEPPLYRLLLEEFDITAKKGEPSGAAYQGIAFGFLRADNPHLQVEIDKVRTGSKRLQRVGDIDAWEGGRLAISAEVKQFVLRATNLDDLQGFANTVGQRGALGIVMALGFEDGVREAVIALGVKALDREDLIRIVELWDPVKQRTAFASVVYYFQHVEKNSSLTERLAEFRRLAEGPSGATEGD